MPLESLPANTRDAIHIPDHNHCLHLTGHLHRPIVCRVAASVSLAYRTTGSVRATAKPDADAGTKCSFIAGFRVEQSPDTGILSCGMGETCIEDETSAVGGRCVVFEEDAVVESHRRLTTCTYADGSPGTFCVGTGACTGTDTSKIGCGSCNGANACNGFYGSETNPGTIAVGEKSCIGTSACQKIYAKYPNTPVVIGDGSCVGTNACLEVYAVYSPGITIGDGSCHDNVGCKFLQGKPCMNQLANVKFIRTELNWWSVYFETICLKQEVLALTAV